MFRRWNYLLPTDTTKDITITPTSSPQPARKTKKHVIAILVEPPPFPGKVGPGVGQGGSHDLAKSTTMQFAGGWQVAPLHPRLPVHLSTCYSCTLSRDTLESIIYCNALVIINTTYFFLCTRAETGFEAL